MSHSTTQKQAIIELDQVGFSYSSGEEANQPALANCSLEIYPGEMLALVGGNGAGKTTLAKLLNGLLIPQQGRVLVAGLDTRQQDHWWEVRQRVGMVFQNPDHQIVAATVEEDVAFGPENLALPPAEIKGRVDRYLQLMDLTAQRENPPAMLSGGQKQRLAIAGVLAMAPQCMVFDEPTAMLDDKGRRVLLTLLQELKTSQQIAVVLITHLMDEAALADRVAVLHQGSVAFTGTPAQLFAQPERLQRYKLTLPPVVEMALLLQGAGIAMDPLPLNTDQLVNILCQSLQAKT